jgi:phosphoglycerol transferase MdoB-like AlkP superfamily enzyme
MIAGVCVIYLKWKLLQIQIAANAFTFPFATASRPGKASALALFAGLRPGPFLSFFRADLAITFFLIPALLLIVGAVFSWRWRVLLIAAFSFLGIVFIDVEYNALLLGGKFLSFDIIWEGIRYALVNTRVIPVYVNLRSMLRLLIPLAGVVTSAVWLIKRPPVPGRKSAGITGSAYGGLILITALAWLPWMTPNEYHESVFATLAGDIWDWHSESQRTIPPDRVQAEYAALAHPPAPQGSGRYWGAAKGYDVLIIMLETTPAKCVALDQDINNYPSMRRLAETGWIGMRHFTTYPWTSRAYYSILSSRYPPDHEQALEIKPGKPPLERGGLMNALASAGYLTAVYGHRWSITSYLDAMLQSQGFEQIVFAARQPQDNWSDVPFEQVRELDKRALELMKRDMAVAIRDDRRFAMMYTPQVGHGPWFDLNPDKPGRVLLDRCRDFVSLLDAWLGELIDFLAQHGRLDHTLIVVTGDHGVRWKGEDPSLPPGKVDKYSFQVPFLLYAPGVISTTERIPWVTSHIDIAPSLLDLLGISSGRELEEGSAIWDERLSNRLTFFWANAHFGADGYADAGKFYMWNRSADLVFAGDDLHFDEGNRVPHGSSDYHKVVQTIGEMDVIRQSYLKAARPEGTGW